MKFLVFAVVSAIASNLLFQDSKVLTAIGHLALHSHTTVSHDFDHMHDNGEHTASLVVRTECKECIDWDPTSHRHSPSDPVHSHSGDLQPLAGAVALIHDQKQKTSIVIEKLEWSASSKSDSPVLQSLLRPPIQA